MSTDILKAKHELRQRTQLAVAAMSPAAKAAASAAIVHRLQASQTWETASSVLLFASLPEEPNLWPLAQEALDRGKTVAFPFYHGALRSYAAGAIRNLERDLEPGYFGIREPVDSCRQLPLNRLDLILIPGVAFDLQGRRLGRGKGFYDRLLAAVRGRGCGIAFDEQLVEEVPTEPHDYLLDCIVTPSRWVELSRTELK